MPPTTKSDARSRKFIAVLRSEVHGQLASKKGAATVVAQARLHGIGRQALFAYRSGSKSPRLELAMQMARDLNTTVERLFELRPVGGRRD